MVIVSIVVTVLLILGVALMSDFKTSSIKEKLISARDFSVQTISDVRDSRKISLKKQVEFFTGSKKQNFFIENFAEARIIMQQTGRANRVKAVIWMSVFFGAIGLVIAILMKNPFIAPTLIVGLSLIPSWYVKITENFLQKHLNSELEVALSTITTSYMRNDNFVLAVEENIKYLNAPIKQVFTKFVNENKLVNSNVVFGVQKIKADLKSTVFHEWCDAIIQCQNDRTLKSTLFPIVNKFSEMKAIQQELDTLMMMPVRDFIMVSLIVVASIPMMRGLNEEWFQALLYTTGGKLILSFVSLCLFYGLNKSINLTKPLEYRV